MTFTEAVKRCLTWYALFSGRASRSEYWWFFLFVILATGIPALVAPGSGFVVEALVILAWLVLILPHLAVASRRLHDSGKSAWWLLLSLVPVGWPVLLVLLAMKPTAGWNRFGPPAL